MFLSCLLNWDLFIYKGFTNFQALPHIYLLHGTNEHVYMLNDLKIVLCVCVFVTLLLCFQVRIPSSRGISVLRSTSLSSVHVSEPSDVFCLQYNRSGAYSILHASASQRWWVQTDCVWHRLIQRPRQQVLGLRVCPQQSAGVWWGHVFYLRMKLKS